MKTIKPIINITTFNDREYQNEYFEVSSFSDLDKSKFRQSFGVCFCNEKLLICKHGKHNFWTLAGGTIEKNESPVIALKREIKEESNMNVLRYQPIGYQKVIEIGTDNYFYQLRYFCVVEPYGPFIEDPAGSIVEIKLIDPSKYKQYFDWGEIGERLIESSLEILKNTKM